MLERTAKATEATKKLYALRSADIRCETGHNDLPFVYEPSTSPDSAQRVRITEPAFGLKTAC